MPTLDQIRSAGVKAVDQRFQENLGIAFLLPTGKVDPARQPVTVRGILRVGAGSGDSPAGRVQSWGMRIAAGKARAWITRDTYTGPALRKGDKVRALDRASQPWWEINVVDDREPERITLHLTEA